MDEAPFPSEGGLAGVILSSQDDCDSRVPDGLGGGPSRTPSLWNLDRATSQLAHKSFGANGSLSGSQKVFTSIGQNCCHFLVRMDNTAMVWYLNRQGGLGADLLSRQSLVAGEWRLPYETYH